MIVLTPLCNKLVKVNFYGNAKRTGPLLNKMVVPDNLLPKLLMITIYNYSSSASSYSYAWSKRTRILNKKAEEIVKPETVMNYLFN